VADSDALRARRKRAHAANDHHLCRHWPEPAPVSSLPSPDPGDGFDPAAEMRRLAGRLAAATRADPANTSLAREYRAVLLVLMGKDGQEADPALAELFETFRSE
jgi:hypothetical protein